VTSLETRKGFVRSDEGWMGDWRPCCPARSGREQGTRFGAHTDVHPLIRVQRCALNISSSSGFRNEDMVQCNVTFIVVSGQGRSCVGNQYNVVRITRGMVVVITLLSDYILPNENIG